MVKPLTALIGLIGAGAIAYILMGSTKATSPAGGTGGAKKQMMDQGYTYYTEETTTPTEGIGVTGGGYQINIPPPPPISFPPLPDPRMYEEPTWTQRKEAVSKKLTKSVESKPMIQIAMGIEDKPESFERILGRFNLSDTKKGG